MRITFDQELAELMENIKEMGIEVEKSYDLLFQAAENKELETLKKIKKSDRYVNDMERQIESKCLTLFTRQQPVARDLRVVSAALKVVTDLERVGDHVVDIAEVIIRVNAKDLGIYSESLKPMIVAAKQLLNDAIDAFVKKDIEEARRVVDGDDVIDDYFNQVKYDLIKNLKAETISVDECVDMMMLNKYLEKIGDHAVNIGDWAGFQETGSIHNIRIL